jgi:hypothetical protein
MWTDKHVRKQTAMMMLNALGVSARNICITEERRFVVVEVCGIGEVRCVSSVWNLSATRWIHYWNKTIISEVSLLTKCWRMVWKYLFKYYFVWMVAWYTKQRRLVEVTTWRIPVAARSKARVFGRCLARIAGLNPAGGHGCLCPVIVVSCQPESLRRADLSSRWVLPGVVCLNVIVKPR